MTWVTVVLTFPPGMWHLTVIRQMSHKTWRHHKCTTLIQAWAFLRDRGKTIEELLNYEEDLYPFKCSWLLHWQSNLGLLDDARLNIYWAASQKICHLHLSCVPHLFNFPSLSLALQLCLKSILILVLSSDLSYVS